MCYVDEKMILLREEKAATLPVIYCRTSIYSKK